MANDLQTALRTIAEYPVTDLSNLDAVNMRHIAQAALTSPVAPEQVVAASAFQKALDIRVEQGWQLGGNACPVLYTDTINGQQVCRDDLWLATTAGLKGASPEAAPAAMEGAAVAWEYQNTHGTKFLTHADPACWHPHDREGFQNFRALNYAAATPAAPSASMDDAAMKQWASYWFGPDADEAWIAQALANLPRAALAQPAPVQQDAPAPSMVGDADMLHGVDALLREAYAHWDADREFKVGKILLALIGHSKGYDKRSDAFRAAISGQKPAEGEKG